MPRLQPLIPLLRPLAAPRPATCHHFRFSTATRLRAEQPSTPPTPQSAQRAADLAAAEAITESDSAQPPAAKPSLPSTHTSTPFPPANKAKSLKISSRIRAATPASSRPTTTFQPATHIELPPPTYHVSRTANKNLPLYTDYKRGGNLHLTTIRKITGDLSALRDELRVFLNKKNEDVKINALTGHVVVKGHVTGEVKQFLEARGM